eukprot:scaffold24008_cov132-Cylindrotheca_fusiformis.AAC.2
MSKESNLDSNHLMSVAAIADFPDTLNSDESDESHTTFFDCQENNNNGNDHTVPSTVQRSANIRFAQPFDDGGKVSFAY